jgi:hypothetical protein
LYQRFLKETQKGQRIQPNGKLIRHSTIDNYVVLFKHIQNYQINRDKVLRIKDWDYLNTREKIAENKYWKNFTLILPVTCFMNWIITTIM